MEQPRSKPARKFQLPAQFAPVGLIWKELVRDPKAFRTLIACTLAMVTTGLEPAFLTLSTSEIQNQLRTPGTQCAHVRRRGFLDPGRADLDRRHHRRLVRAQGGHGGRTGRADPGKPYWSADPRHAAVRGRGCHRQHHCVRRHPNVYCHRHPGLSTSCAPSGLWHVVRHRSVQRLLWARR